MPTRKIGFLAVALTAGLVGACANDGSLIITEAGGSITGYDGSPALTAGGAFTTNGLLHEVTAKLLQG